MALASKTRRTGTGFLFHKPRRYYASRMTSVHIILCFAVHRQNQSCNIPIAEGVLLETTWIIGVFWHVIWTDRTRKLGVPQNSHNLQEVHLAFIWEYLAIVVQSASDCLHVYLANFFLPAEILDDGEYVDCRVPQTRRHCS